MAKTGFIQRRVTHTMIIDAHCHLTATNSENDVAILTAVNAGFGKLFLGGVDPSDWMRQEALRAKHGEIIATSFGLHPWYVSQHDDADCEKSFELLQAILKNTPDAMAALGGKIWRRPWGLGETGLDHAVAKSSTEKIRQRHWFMRHLELSAHIGIPVIVHCVRAYGAIIDCIATCEGQQANERQKLIRGLIHGFRGNRSLIHQLAGTGLLISVGPNAFVGPNTDDLADIPDHLLAFESDAPQGALGRHHHSAHPIDSLVVLEIAKKIAAIRQRGETPQDVLTLAASNVKRVFDRPDKST